MKVLLVEDDPALAAEVSRALRSDHQVRVAATVSAARDLLESFAPGFLLLDRSLPDGDGIELLRDLRTHGNPIPTIVLTSFGDPTDRVEGLDAGADDYLHKPFHLDELRARIRSVARRVTVDEVVSLGALRIDMPTRKATLDGEPIELTSRELALLVTFARQPGRVLERSELLAQAWGIQHDPHTNVVDVYVRHLRAKLGDDWIETVRGQGYRMPPRDGSVGRGPAPDDA